MTTKMDDRTRKQNNINDESEKAGFGKTEPRTVTGMVTQTIKKETYTTNAFINTNEDILIETTSDQKAK